MTDDIYQLQKNVSQKDREISELKAQLKAEQKSGMDANEKILKLEAQLKAAEELISKTCQTFITDYSSTSATKCANCGKEKHQH